MIDVLNAAFRAAQGFAQRSLALCERPSSQILAVEHKQIEGAGDRSVIHDATVKYVKIRLPVTITVLIAASLETLV